MIWFVVQQKKKKKRSASEWGVSSSEYWCKFFFLKVPFYFINPSCSFCLLSFISVSPSELHCNMAATCKGNIKRWSRLQRFVFSRRCCCCCCDLVNRKPQVKKMTSAALKKENLGIIGLICHSDGWRCKVIILAGLINNSQELLLKLMTSRRCWLNRSVLERVHCGGAWVEARGP